MDVASSGISFGRDNKRKCWLVILGIAVLIATAGDAGAQAIYPPGVRKRSSGGFQIRFPGPRRSEPQGDRGDSDRPPADAEQRIVDVNGPELEAARQWDPRNREGGIRVRLANGKSAVFSGPGYDINGQEARYRQLCEAYPKAVAGDTDAMVLLAQAALGIKDNGMVTWQRVFGGDLSLCGYAWLVRAAELGNGRALFYLGQACAQGEHRVPRIVSSEGWELRLQPDDTSRAISFHQRAFDAGEARAAHFFITLYKHGSPAWQRAQHPQPQQGVVAAGSRSRPAVLPAGPVDGGGLVIAPDIGKEFEWVVRGADAGDVQCMKWAVDGLYKGDKAPQNMVAVAKYCQALRERRDSYRQDIPVEKLRWLTEYRGRYSPQDFAREYGQWMYIWAASNSDEGMMKYAIYLLGSGKKEDAVAWGQRALRSSGSPRTLLAIEGARSVVAAIVAAVTPKESGEYGKRESARLLAELVAVGKIRPSEVARFYRTGSDGWPQDAEAALFWDKAALQSGEMAVYDLARIHIETKGDPRSVQRADELFEMAIAAGKTRPSVIGRAYLVGKSLPRDVEQGVKWLSPAAEKGEGGALVLLGRLAETGQWGGKPDPEKAAGYYRKAAEVGDPWGMALYACQLARGSGVKADVAASDAWFRKAIAADTDSIATILAQTKAGWVPEPGDKHRKDGRTDALLLATMFAKGDYLPKDSARALPWYVAAVDAKLIPAKDVAAMLSTGDGVPKDLAAARTYYAKAVEANEIPAEDVAAMLVSGSGVDKDLAAARAYYAKAVAAGEIPAQQFAAMLASGDKVEKDPKLADEYYARAVKAKEITATGVARLYFSGEGVPCDLARALHWAEVAAAAGDSDAMVLGGQVAEKDDALEQRNEVAAQWYERAAQAKRPEGFVALGRFAEQGIAGARDYGKAMELYKKAAELNYADAYICVGNLHAQGKGVAKNERVANRWYQEGESRGAKRP